MARRSLLVIVALAAVVVASALVVVLITWDRGGTSADAASSDAPSEIEARGTFAPRAALFGDTVRAQADVTVDTGRVDPGSVRVAADFSPWEVVGTPERVVRSAGDTAFVRTTFTLRCLSGACAPTSRFELFDFPHARVTFATPDGQGRRESSIRMAWPPMPVYSRYSTVTVEGTNSAAPWRTDLLSLPAPSYRLSPGVLIVLLLLGAGLAGLVAVVLLYAVWPRRVPVALAEPEPERPPEPVLSPLEQALVLLEQSIRVDGASDHRRALELVAEELEQAEWGDPDLARTARVLAWSEGAPPIDETTGLAARVRSSLPVVVDEEEALEERDVA